MLVKARAWYLTIYFHVGDLTGMIGGWELKYLTFPSLGTMVFLLGLALGRSAPTLAGSGPVFEWSLTHREPMGSWQRITYYWFGSADAVWTGHRSRTGTMRLSRNSLVKNEGRGARR